MIDLSELSLSELLKLRRECNDWISSKTKFEDVYTLKINDTHYSYYRKYNNVIITLKEFLDSLKIDMDLNISLTKTKVLNNRIEE